MKYTKPEISELGDVTSLMRDLVTKDPNAVIFEACCPDYPIQPSYDLDE